MHLVDWLKQQSLVHKKAFIAFTLGVLLIVGVPVLYMQWVNYSTSRAVKQAEDLSTAETNTNINNNDETSLDDIIIPPPGPFGAGVVYQDINTNINPAIAKDFNINSIKNISEIEKAYGFKFSAEELQLLKERKFVLKNILDTKIRPVDSRYEAPLREFVQLYNGISGDSSDYKSRGPENTLFYSSDVFLNTYSILYTELLREMENEKFFPAIKSLTKTFYESSNQKFNTAQTDLERQKWLDVRNYFVVPYAILSNAASLPTNIDYYSGEELLDPDQVMARYVEKDKGIDIYENVAKFIINLNLDDESESAILEDLQKIYAAGDKSLPTIFTGAYSDMRINFQVDFTQFTPRGTYTSSSLRRQYFRAMKWYIMLPFFIKSPRLTTDAFAIAQLMAENQKDMQRYSAIDDAINFLIGTSDDLMPVDYLQALDSAKGAKDEAAAAMEYLIKARNPKIKDLAATYSAVGTEQSADVLLETKGMRFLSGKFIVDSYWTDFLTQGDEAIMPGYTQKLPPMASAIEIMTLLGSDYAASQIPKMDFYGPTTSEAIDKAMGELMTQNAQLTDQDWQQNIYTTWLWTIKSLFSWTKQHISVLPQFMQSKAWAAKTLMTASAFWTELRHATILYAKQSFAEMGGGPDNDCDSRRIPAPPKGYIEPQQDMYNRLLYLAQRTQQGLEDRGYKLDNMEPLKAFIGLMTTVQSYVAKELTNEILKENVTSKQRPDPKDDNKTCTEYFIEDTSDWEVLRVQLVNDLARAMPRIIEGPILSAKDKRAAIVADVHTGGDSGESPRILYEGTGVPYVIFTAVSDANGPRLTVGFVSSQFEFTRPYGGQRLTDEDWQNNFYSGDNEFEAFHYISKISWPKINSWYEIIFK